MENCGYSGNTTSRLTPSRLMASMASSVNGFQYRMPTYALAAIPRVSIAVCSALACASVIRRSGEPPPMDSYASRLFGARDELKTLARKPCKSRSGPGNRMMDGSANKLYRNGCTSSNVSGPPRLSKRTPTLYSSSSKSSRRPSLPTASTPLDSFAAAAPPRRRGFRRPARE